jgi:hypothetical protein
MNEGHARGRRKERDNDFFFSAMALSHYPTSGKVADPISLSFHRMLQIGNSRPLQAPAEGYFQSAWKL